MVRSRKWGNSNIFSELHRKNIPGYLCLFDIDGIYLEDDKVKGIYEGKYSMYSRDKGDFIETFGNRDNVQSLFLNDLSQKIPVWISEESSNRWWNLNKGVLLKSFPPSLNLIDTSDRIYAGYKISKFSGTSIYSIFHRTLGERPPKNDSESDMISKILECEKILVNDSIEGKIFFKNNEKKEFFEGSLEEGVSWMNQWKNLGII